MTYSDFLTLLQQMQEPEFYPHPVQTPIELIQTHASAVLLTGDYAYKLKKSVDFGFLDYSTLAKRQHFLNEELRLNKPVAPDIYLEVLPIAKSGDRFILGDTLNPIEYVLKMAQFPEDNLLINMFESGKLMARHIEELGRVVAQFHGQSRTDDYIQSFGNIDKIKETIDDNYSNTEKYVGLAQTQKQYEETRQFTDSFLQEKRECFEQRKATNKIRECHGDLHLKNICWWQGKIQLFDRIEFNEEFRFVDVIYDIAFTVMDLDARKRQDFSNIFLNTYLEQTGDWQGLQILPLYLSRQAYVRAKVNSMISDDPGIPELEKQQAIAAAKNYYHLAWKYTQKSQGKLILMSGLSGSGKTTVARQLAQKINAIHLRSDAVRKHLAGIPLTSRGGDDLYTKEMTQKTYHRLLELGEMLIPEGYTVILDAKFDRQMWRTKAMAIAQSHNVPLEIIYCTAPLEILVERLSQRTGDISDATPNLLATQQEMAEPLTNTEQTFTQIVDTNNPDF